MVCLVLGACGVTQKPYHEEGRQYGVIPGPFRDKWWNYYERGLSFADGGFFPEAIRDLSEAVRRRAADQWRARTYGMHFLRYFPHRELGIVYYRLDRPEDAIRELEASLSTAASAKAAYFLNRARKALLERTGLDRLPPSLALRAPRDGVVTNAFETLLAGVATDDQFVAAVSVNGRPLLLEQSTARFEFETPVPLREGANEIRVRAEDLVGRGAAMTLAITVDRRGPVITVADWTRRGTKHHLTGYVADETGIVRYSVNGQEVAGHLEREIALDVEAGADTLRIEAVDRAGNVTVAELAPARKASLPSPGPRLASLAGPPPGALRGLRHGPTGGAFSLNLGGLFDGEPPAIALRGVPDRLETFHDRILIEGSASDATGVESLTVNGEPATRRAGRRIFFSHLLGLAVGKNRIEVEARDSRGNVRTRELVVERKVQKVRQLGSRMSVALLTLEHQGPATVAGVAVDDRLASAFVEERRFNLVERERIRDVLTELGLSASRLADPNTAPRLGRVVAADAILTGTVVETEHSIEIVTTLVDSETAAVVSANDAFAEARTLSSVGDLTARLAFKYTRDFPMLEGAVIEAEGRHLLVDLGSESRLRPHQKLILFREEPDSPSSSGESLDADTREIGEAKVREVFPEYSEAELIRGGRDCRPTDGVITR